MTQQRIGTYSASGPTIPLTWRHEIAFAHPSQSTLNNLAIPLVLTFREWGANFALTVYANRVFRYLVRKSRQLHSSRQVRA
ncbi:MAG: hypothetical protein ACJAUZ_002870 [Flavobacteriaceae bacterium]|jgi:hypothetical protein